MVTLNVLGPFLVLVFGQVAYAEEPKRAEAAQPATDERSREQALETRIEELERKLETLSGQFDNSNTAPIPERGPIDPDFAKAADKDAIAKAPTDASSATSQPSVLPVTKMNPDISFILDVGGAWYNKANHFKQGGHAMTTTGSKCKGWNWPLPLPSIPTSNSTLTSNSPKPKSRKRTSRRCRYHGAYRRARDS